MKRYNVISSERRIGTEIYADPEGRFVLYSDALAAIEQARSDATASRNADSGDERPAAPPSTTQSVADVVSANHPGPCGFIDNYALPEGTNLYAAPPDLAARVKELEGLLRLSRPYLDAWQVKRHADDRGIAGLIDAALAEDWK